MPMQELHHISHCVVLSQDAPAAAAAVHQLLTSTRTARNVYSLLSAQTMPVVAVFYACLEFSGPVARQNLLVTLF